MIARAVRLVMVLLPLFFAFGFLAPVFAQGMDALAIEAPFGLTRLIFALAVAGIWGLVATVTGRWI